MTTIGVAVATAKFLFGMYDCTVDSDVARAISSLGMLHVCGHAHVRSNVSQGMECIPNWSIHLFHGYAIKE